MISTELAYRLRFHRGLKLPLDAHYEIDRLREIAIEQSDLFDRLDILDNEILMIYDNEKHDGNT